LEENIKIIWIRRSRCCHCLGRCSRKISDC